MTSLTTFLRAFWQGARETPAGFVAPLVWAWTGLRRALVGHSVKFKP